MKRSNIKKIENINLITNDTEFYKSIFDSSLQNKVIVENGIIIEINDKALENISSRKENVIGKKLSHYFPHLQPDGEQSLIKSRRIFKQVVQNNNRKRGFVNSGVKSGISGSGIENAVKNCVKYSYY